MVRYTATKVIRHPNYDPLLIDNDICLIYTKKRIKYDASVTPACLPGKRSEIGERCFVAGWGRTSQWGRYKNVLQEVAVNVIGQD